MILAQLLTFRGMSMEDGYIAMLLSALWLHPFLLGIQRQRTITGPTQLTQTRRSTQELLQQHEEVADGLLEQVGAFFVKFEMESNIRLTKINL